MKLDKNQQTFPELFSALLKTRSNFEYIEKNDDHHSLCISKITDYKRCG